MRLSVNKIILAGLLFVSISQASYAGLLGTNLSLDTVFQRTSTSPIINLSLPTTATVIEPGIEFPSVLALLVSNPDGLVLADTSINVGDDFLEIDFDNATNISNFDAAIQNTYVFTFDSTAALSITSATIDTAVTTLGIIESDISFSGNQLFVNVEGLSFDTSTFARINLSSVDVPVPTPATIILFLIGLTTLGFIRRLKISG